MSTPSPATSCGASLVLNSNGKVARCLVYQNAAQYADLRKMSVAEAYNHPSVQTARRLFGRKPMTEADAPSPCSDCGYFERHHGHQTGRPARLRPGRRLARLTRPGSQSTSTPHDRHIKHATAPSRPVFPDPPVTIEVASWIGSFYSHWRHSSLSLAFLVWNRVSTRRHQETGGNTTGLGGPNDPLAGAAEGMRHPDEMRADLDAAAATPLDERPAHPPLTGAGGTARRAASPSLRRTLDHADDVAQRHALGRGQQVTRGDLTDHGP